MSVVCTSDLQNKLNTLRPAPKAPVSTESKDKPAENEFKAIKLKPVKPPPTVEHNKDNPVEKTESDDNSNNNTGKTRTSSVKERSKTFENGSPGKPPVPGKPAVASKKPAVGSKPPVRGKPVNGGSKQNTEISRARPPSVANKPDSKIKSTDNGGRIPELKPLPPECALGGPPQKPPKFGNLLKPSLAKYVGTSYPPRPVVPQNTPSTKSGNDDESKPAVENAPVIPAKPPKPERKQSEEKSPIDVASTSVSESAEDFYDDTTVSTNVDDTEDFYDDTTTADSNISAPSEDFYDDTNACSSEIATNEEDEKFGEDIYEPIAGNQEELTKPPSETLPPKLPAKDQGKEDKKKKEKERKKKEKEEKEEKERDEKEKKKREKEREKKNSEMKRRFSVKGTEKSMGTCTAAVDIPGNRMDIAASIGDELDIIRKGKPNPPNKWLVRNKQGQYGFIDIDKTEAEPADDGEDLYEEVPASKMRTSQTSNGNDVPAPPAISPPPPPTQSAPRPPTADQEIYDDVAGQEEPEELYELLPE